MESLFVSVTSFCDPHLRFTLSGLFQNAVTPGALQVAVIDQSRDGNREWIEQQPWAAQVQYIQVDPIDSRGCSWARSIAFSCFRGEDFVLQIDSHTLCDPGWDETLLGELECLVFLNERAILTAYPPPFEFDADGGTHKPLPVANTAYWMNPVAEQTLSRDGVTLRFHTEHVFNADFVANHHIAGGFLFAPGRFVQEVPYDPYLYFHGDEQSLALRAFTRGWSIYGPAHAAIPFCHLYQRAGTAHATQHWRPEFERARSVKFTEFSQRAKRRLCDLVDGRLADTPWGLGRVRSLAEFAAESGVDYPNRTIATTKPSIVRLMPMPERLARAANH